VTTLVLVGHGTRDPRGTATVGRVAGQVRRLLPGVTVRTAFFDCAQPTLSQALERTPRGRTVVVPLLLSTGVHVRVDIPRVVATHRPDALVVPHLGPDRRVVRALGDRLAEAGAPRAGPVVLAAAGSSDPAGTAEVETAAALLEARLCRPVGAAFVSAAHPRVSEAIELVRVNRGPPVAVASYLLARGQFHQEVVAAAAGCAVSPPLGPHPSVIDLVLARYREAGESPA
jgi:sirohydrochlorin ferrochelatase